MKKSDEDKDLFKNAMKNVTPIKKNRRLYNDDLSKIKKKIRSKYINNQNYENSMLELNISADEVEQLIGDLVVDSAVALNPFLFRNFWMGIDTRWPAGGDTGVMIVRICNDGNRPIPEMRLAPPIPDGWQCVPSGIDLPILRPGDVILVRFDIKPGLRFSLDEIPLSRKLTIQTGYEVNAGQVNVTMRVQNRSMESIRDILLQPWMPPGYKVESLPLVEKLSPDETGVVNMPLVIDMGDGGGTAA